MKSILGYVFKLACGAISWKMCSSVIHHEGRVYGLLNEVNIQAVLFKYFISQMNIVDSISKPIMIFCDNASLAFYSKNNKGSSGLKHIDIKYLMVRDKIKEG